ncbi:MAG: lytic murein transglycosylase [Acidobacteria bacterium]|nr:lytic murein transglycosylase [Acidobacteriota bacterium]
MLQRSRIAALFVAMALVLHPAMHASTLTGGGPAAAAALAAPAPLAATDGQAVQTAVEPIEFPAFVESLRVEALARGISEGTIARALSNLEPSASVIARDQSQAEVILTVDQYVARRLTRPFVRTAQQMAARHRTLLNRVAATYGVPSRVVVSIWGLESNFGRFSGVRPTIQALATLAWEGRRGAFFRAELMDALEIVDRGYIGLEMLRGSWAGAMGQAQFMPSSYLKWAQDFDSDGDRDIWRSEPDVFASVANYLKEHGWAPATTWGREVRLPAGGIAALREKVGMRGEGCRAEREMTNRLPLGDWQALGVRTAAGGALPKVAVDASLIHSGQRGFLVYGNYESLLEYNCAHSYALAVALLSDRVGT